MSHNQLVIVGGGFAGVWAALAAVGELHRRDAEHKTVVTLVSPSPALGVRPRFYEQTLDGVQVPLAAILAPVGVRHRRARVEELDSDARRVTLAGAEPGSLRYDQLVLASGSWLEIPSAEPSGRVHSVDSYQEPSHCKPRSKRWPDQTVTRAQRSSEQGSRGSRRPPSLSVRSGETPEPPAVTPMRSRSRSSMPAR